jgi:hypothetical protein
MLAGSGQVACLWLTWSGESVSVLVMCLAGGMNRNQQEVVEYLQEEVRALKEMLGNAAERNDLEGVSENALRRIGCHGSIHGGGMDGQGTGVSSRAVRHQSRDAFGENCWPRAGAKRVVDVTGGSELGRSVDWIFCAPVVC